MTQPAPTNPGTRKGQRARPIEADGPPTAAVRLEFTHATAATVWVAGTFNECRPEATPMISLGNGRWMKDLVLPPGRYEYCLVADGDWMADPLAQETVPNPFGGLNGVLRVPGHRSQPARNHEG